MEISGVSSSYSNILNAIEYSNNPATIGEAVLANAEIEDRVEISVAALKMAQEAEQFIAMQLIQGATQSIEQA